MNRIITYIILFFIVVSFGCSKAKVDTNNLNDSSKNLVQANNKETGASAPIKSSEDLTIKTSDNIDLSAKYFFTDGKKDENQPLVILIHQFRQAKEQWKHDYIDSLIASGFKVLAYDIRGHGNSSKVSYNLGKLLDDPKEAPNDIIAVFKWAKEQTGIDSSRIGVIGTSIGGNLACYAALNLNAKVVVSVSNGKETFEIYTGYDERMMGRPYFPKFKNALFICGNKDGGHETGQKWIIDNFVESPKDLKVYDSDKHGKDLIDAFPEINLLTINWFKKYL